MSLYLEDWDNYINLTYRIILSFRCTLCMSFCVGKQEDMYICIKIHAEKEKWSLGISLICSLDYVCYVYVYLMSDLLRYHLGRVKFIFFMCKML